MSKNRHPELEGYSSEPLYVLELKSQRTQRRHRLGWILSGLLIGVGVSTGLYFYLTHRSIGSLNGTVQLPDDDPFKLGTTRAMDAAELTQTAEFKEDWSQVALLWQQAIQHMSAVPSSHRNHAIAQQKRGEYTNNLAYAQSNVRSRRPSNPQAQPYWTLGSDRDLLLVIQGMPTRIIQFDTSCREVFYYGDSMVELQNGYITDYSNSDNNLDVLGNQANALSIRAQDNTWTLGSTEETVFNVQGTPNRTSTYRNSKTLHYGSSFVEIQNGRVVGYDNDSNNLNVSVLPINVAPDQTPPTEWTLGASRHHVLSAEQQTPTAISRLDTSCEELFMFDSSTVKFRKGLVSEYSDTDGNLSIN